MTVFQVIKRVGKALEKEIYKENEGVFSHKGIGRIRWAPNVFEENFRKVINIWESLILNIPVKGLVYNIKIMSRKRG